MLRCANVLIVQCIACHEISPPAPAANLIRACGADWIRIGETEYRQNLIVTPDAVVAGWAPAGFAALTADDFASLLKYAPEVVLLGTGATPALSPLPPYQRAGASAHRRRGDGQQRAACRTFNILVAEDRRVVAALTIG